jgi:sugar lactone lactonase YvrE
MRSFSTSTFTRRLGHALPLVALPLFALFALGAPGCKKPAGNTGAGGGPSTSPNGSVAATSASAAANRPPPLRTTGAGLARAANDKALYLADEDASILRRVPLPLVKDGPVYEQKLAGPPAHVLAHEGELFVTQRDPGALLVLVDETDLPDGKLREVANIKLPGDAWGMALSPDESTLLVTSAWTHKVSVVDVKQRVVLATLDVPREPRGVVFAPDGKRAYVTHLMGTAVTRIDVAGKDSAITRVPLPAGTTHAPRNVELSASLAYAPVISNDGKRLFVSRHALGGLTFDSGGTWSGSASWWGVSTIDVLLLRDETPLTPKRAAVAMVGRFGAASGLPATPTTPEAGAFPSAASVRFVQPRDAVYRASTRTILIASEGTDDLSEHDADALDPGLVVEATYSLGSGYLTGKLKQPTAETGGAPTALALSADERTAYVWARGNREIWSVPLRGGRAEQAPTKEADTKASAMIGPIADPLGKEAAAGRRLFLYAGDNVTSGLLACAGCHPDGRDDGFVWREGRHEKPQSSHPHEPVFFALPAQLIDPENEGRARQTPMLAGRVSAEGPYGWHAQSKNLEARLLEGFSLHRWSPPYKPPTAYEKANRLAQLKAFLRTGLRPPPRDTSPLTPQEEKGKALFEDDKTLCKSCHPAATEFTTRAATPLKSPLPTRAGYFTDEDQSFKVPSLLFVGGTAPYYHDGSASSLTDLVEKNGNRMGNTAQLSAEERSALVAYLERL